MIDARPFIALIKRTTKSKYDSLIMNNRMILQCYDISEDSDVGLHYILHIPDTVPYNHDFYDTTMVINISEILTTYQEGKTIQAAYATDNNIKPKELREELYTEQTDTYQLKLKFVYYAKDHTVTTTSVNVESPLRPTNRMIDNIETSIANMILRVKPGGSCVILDGHRSGIYQLAMESSQIAFYRIRMNHKVIRIPVYRSMLLGQKNIDLFTISVQETVIPMIYLYTIQMERQGLVEQFIGYVQNF